MKELYTISFECEVLTPMFLGSSNPRDAELRPPSIKGAMRYWWRAMNGNLDIEELRKKEGDIFGSSAGTGKKSKVIISLNSDKVIISTQQLPNHPVIEYSRRDRNTGRVTTGKMDAITFFAYGKTPSRDRNTNQMGTWAEYIKPGSAFTIKLSSFDQTVLAEAVKSFLTLAHFGGLGGKSKNGFGSFQILKIDGSIPEFAGFNPASLIKGEGIPSYPAFSAKSVVIEHSDGKNTWDIALADMAMRYQLSKKVLKKTGGLPESNTFENKKELVGMLLSRSDIKLPNRPKRIPKPFHMKIFKNPENKYCERILFLPSKFLEGKRNSQNENSLATLQKEFLAYLDLMVRELRK